MISFENKNIFDEISVFELTILCENDL